MTNDEYKLQKKLTKKTKKRRSPRSLVKNNGRPTKYPYFFLAETTLNAIAINTETAGCFYVFSYLGCELNQLSRIRRVFIIFFTAAHDRSVSLSEFKASVISCVRRLSPNRPPVMS